MNEYIEKAIDIAGSQVALAKKSGLTQGAISKYKRGLMQPSGKAAKRLEEAVEKQITRDQFAPDIFT